MYDSPNGTAFMLKDRMGISSVVVNVGERASTFWILTALRLVTQSPVRQVMQSGIYFLPRRSVQLRGGGGYMVPPHTQSIGWTSVSLEDNAIVRVSTHLHGHGVQAF